MTTYRIRGVVSRTTPPLDTTSTERIEFLSDVFVEAWDKDERFDDRFGKDKTDRAGIFEIQFTDADIQQDPLEKEWHPDIFFKVYQGRQLLFSTEGAISRQQQFSGDTIGPIVSQGIQWNWQTWESSTVLPRNPGNFIFFQEVPVSDINNPDRYRIELLNAWEIPDRPAPQPSPITFPEDAWENTIIDVLPTLDRVERSGRTLSATPLENPGGSLQEIVNSAFDGVLCRHSHTEAKSFIEALKKTFSPQQNNGRTNYVWIPCSYNTAQSELGGTVSGAQASLYHRAKAALNEMLPLLDRLSPLNSAADPQNLESARAIVRTEIVELVNELGTQGGPRVQRVDSLFKLLIGNIDTDTPYEVVGGQLRELADTFGLTRSAVNTVEEEQNYGNYLIIRDYLISLRGSWKTYIENSGGGAYVGSQLVLLSQALSVVGESVREAYGIMDLVFLGAAERQSVWIDFTKTKVKIGENEYLEPGQFPLPDGTLYAEGLQLTPGMTIESLLSWVMSFATQEGPALARSGGKIGIARSLKETADRLMILVQAASFVPVPNTAYRRAGVTRSFKDLAFQLYQVKRLAQELIPPLTSSRSLDADDAIDLRRLPSQNRTFN